MDTKIDTGVDKLVRLVNERGKIELGDAAKSLGVPTALVQEWADFLQEEKLIDTEYSLTKNYLCKKNLSKDEITQKTKEYQGKKEALIRKIDTSLQQLDQKMGGFNAVKEQFDILGELQDMGEVREDVEMLRHFEDLKKSVDTEIEEQQVQYGSAVEELNHTLQKEQARYDTILSDIEKETLRLKNERSEVQDLATDEETLAKRLLAFEEIVRTIREKLTVEATDIHLHEDRLQKLHTLADQLHNELATTKQKDLTQLKKISEDQGARIKRLQQEILDKVKDRLAHQHHLEGHADEVAKRLESLFAQREHLTTLIKQIDNDEQGLKMELGQLLLKAKAFDVATHGDEMNKHIAELTQRFKEFGEQKETLNAKLSDLHKELDTLGKV